jgi:methyl-accepting chemotaxis protein
MNAAIERPTALRARFQVIAGEIRKLSDSSTVNSRA